MRKKKPNILALLSAIHAVHNGYSFDTQQQQAYDEFRKKNSLNDIPFDPEVLKHMQGAEERKQQSWAALQSKLTKS